MNKSFAWYRSATVVIFLIVVSSVFGGAVVMNHIMGRRITDYFNRCNASDLALAASMGFQICENHFEELINLRLSDNDKMVETMRRDSIAMLENLPEQFNFIDIILVENSSDIVLSTIDKAYIDPEIFQLPKKIPEGKAVYSLSDGSIIRWLYFPFWRWHIIALMTSDHALIPVRFMQYTVLYILAGILAVFTVSLLLVFGLKVRRPLKILTKTAERVKNGNMVKTGIKKHDEIGIAAEAFDEMVDGLSVTMDELRKTVNDKNLLLMEVHHRVRNNLNIIISLLNLRMHTLKNTDDLIQVFEDSKNRIMTMALVHGNLYETGSFGRLQIDMFLPELAAYLREVYDPDNRIKLEFEVEPLMLDIDRAVTVGLLVNEILTNAFRHAFNGPEGLITISLNKSDNGFILAIRDNGVGAPSEIFEGKRTSLGISLIHELACQLKGTIEITSENGVSIIVRFPGNNDV